MDLDSEIISMVIFHLLLIQEGQLSVTDKSVGSNTLEDYTCPGGGLCGSIRCLSDQEAVGLIPVKSGNMLSWRLIMKWFLWSLSHSLLLI